MKVSIIWDQVQDACRHAGSRPLAATLGLLKMEETYEPIDEHIHTADAENPRLSYENGEIVFKFTDWQEIEREIKFYDVAGYKWQDEIDLGFPDRDDMPYQVNNSKWIAELKELNVLDSDMKYMHYKLCFNACGVLDIVFKNLEIKA